MKHKRPQQEQMFSFDLVTPEMAARLLATHTPLRPLSPAHIDFLAEIMKRDQWLDTGEPIIFDRTGKLLNGFHRLSAIVRCGIAQRMRICRGVDPKASMVIDTHRKRSFGSFLTEQGYENSTTLAAALWILFYYRLSGGEDIRTRFLKPGIDQLFELLGKEKELPASCHWAKKVNRVMRGHGAMWSVVHYLCAKVDKSDADLFLDALATGVSLPSDDPVYQFRETYIRRYNEGIRISAQEAMIRTLHCWNNFREGKKVVKYSPPRTETLPALL